MRKKALEERGVIDEPVAVERLRFTSPPHLPFTYDPALQRYK